MIKLELKAVPEGGREYRVVATLCIDDHGQIALDDPQGVVPLRLPALVVRDGDLVHVRFEDDPVVWVQHVDSILRTGYLVPVITYPVREPLS